MLSDSDALQAAIDRDGASVISGATDELRAVRRCNTRPYTPDNLVTVTLDETYRLADDLTLKRIGGDRGWFVRGHEEPEAVPVKYPDGKHYRLDRFGTRTEVRVERRNR